MRLYCLLLPEVIRHIGDHPILNLGVFWSRNTLCLADYEMFNKVKSYLKIDGLQALSMVQGSMSADQVVSAAGPWDEPKFKLAM